MNISKPKAVIYVALLWLILVPAGAACSAPSKQKDPQVITRRQYDLRDARFCMLTPAPFLCQECLPHGGRLIQILAKYPDGRLLRSYECHNSKEKNP